MALAGHPWPPNMGTPSVYLQGSYRNHTNIRGDSDVDAVAENSCFFYSNLTPAQFQQAGWSPSPCTWTDLNNQVYAALVAHYGASLVRQGNKCINVGGEGNRLNADVVACCEYKRFGPDHRNHVSGITFWTRSDVQVINYPKLHHDNGAKKNASCNEFFKPLIRVFKNARNRAQSDFPSYFLECLLYNVADSQYAGTFRQMFCNALSSLVVACTDGSMANWWCQNRQQKIFGHEIHQTEIAAARAFLVKLSALWENWR